LKALLAELNPEPEPLVVKKPVVKKVYPKIELKLDANGIPAPPNLPPLPPLPDFDPSTFVLKKEIVVLKAPVPIMKDAPIESRNSVNTDFMEKNADVLDKIKAAINFGCRDDDSDEDDDDSSDSSYSSASD